MKCEVTNILRKLETGKATGPDHIENKILKEFAEELGGPLTRLFNKILEEEIVPKQWEEAVIILLRKKGVKKNIKIIDPSV